MTRQDVNRSMSVVKGDMVYCVVCGCPKDHTDDDCACQYKIPLKHNEEKVKDGTENPDRIPACNP